MRSRAVLIAVMAAVVASIPAVEALQASADQVRAGKGRSPKMKIGGWKVSYPNRPTAAQAMRRVPGRMKITKNKPGHCVGRWKHASMAFVTFGGPVNGQVPDCKSRPDLLLLQRADFTGRRWKTTKGLRIGDPVRKLKRKYPNARQGDQPYRLGAFKKLPGTSYWLVVYRSPYGDQSRAARLQAIVQRGKVTRISLWVGAAGD